MKLDVPEVNRRCRAARRSSDELTKLLTVAGGIVKKPVTSILEKSRHSGVKRGEAVNLLAWWRG
jgi:hypothetical protein